jgi:hypothetical protein
VLTSRDWSDVDMAIDTDREALHALLDAVPDERLAEAKSAIGALADPVMAALLAAQPEDEELSTEELAELEAVDAERAAGTIAYVTDAELAVSNRRDAYR